MFLQMSGEAMEELMDEYSEEITTKESQDFHVKMQQMTKLLHMMIKTHGIICLHQ